MEEYNRRITDYFEMNPEIVKAKLILNLPKIRELEAFEEIIHRPITGLRDSEIVI